MLAAGQVLINEVLFDPQPDSPDSFRQHQWVEIVNKGTEPVSLQDYRITGRGGSGTGKPLPAVTLPAGGYLTLHFSDGEDRPEAGEYYTKDPTGTLVWNPAKDEAALYAGDKIVDFLAWHSGLDAFEPGKAHNDAVAAGIWVARQYMRRNYIARGPEELYRYVTSGESIGRDARSSDNNQPLDFDAGGGIDALGPTPGRSNLDLMSLSSDEETQSDAKRPARRAIPAKARWTVMLYMACETEPSVIESLCLGYLRTIARQGGSNNNVNYVAQFDRRYGSIFDTDRKKIDAGALRGCVRGKALPRLDEVPLVPRQPQRKPRSWGRQYGSAGDTAAVHC